MPKLSDTQLVILGAAAQRADLSVLPLPETLKLKGGALNKVMDSLRNGGMIRVTGADGGPERVVITSEGMAAIGVEADGDEEAAAADTAPTSAEGDSADNAAAPATEADGAARPAKGKGKAKAIKAAPPTSEPEAAGEPTAKPTPRAGTKQAPMIDLLKRPEGAIVEQIVAATGWQHHTIRGAISGALKKKLGLTVEATRTREVGPNKTGAKGSSTVYLQRALAELERTDGTRIRSIVGINHDGVFGSTWEGWGPDLPEACNEPFVPLLWLKVLELLGRVPEGSTARFLEDGTLPD